MKVYCKEDKIIFEDNFWTKRFNPYMIKENGEPEDVGSHPTYIGLICKDQFGNDEMGFAYVIDMDYKDKADQWTDIMIKYQGEIETFKKLCEDLKIDWVDIRLSDLNTDYEND